MDPTTHNNNDSSSNTRETNGNGNGNGNGNRSLTRKSRKKKKYESHSHHPPLVMSTTVTCCSSSSSSSSSVVYRECLKNHAASIGGQALDGCGEFMASPSSNPSDPSSLTCAACSCHRNFHRRLPTISFEEEEIEEEEEEEEEEDEKQFDDINVEDDEGDIMSMSMCSDHGAHSTSPPPQLATHMLLALSTGYPPATATATATATQKKKKNKRFRSKFSQEQKEKMRELSERLGWRLQRRDDAIVEAACREIGITRRVFKVWMHNNKHIIFITNNKSISSIPPQPDAAPLAAPNANGHGIQNLGMRSI